MWQQQKKDSLIINLALLMSMTTSPMVASFLISAQVQAESQTHTPAFSLPQTVENGTIVKIDGSANFLTLNQTLKENFEKQFSGTQVEVAINGNEEALKAILDGKVDLAALGRELTPEEKAQGLEQILVRREKIAIIVSNHNPFQGGLTTEQLAKIFRGEITDWSQVGNAQGKIRLIDHPDHSDTRASLSEYPAFKSGQFANANAVQMLDDNTANIIKELGHDGISYVLANQVSKLPAVRVLKIQDFSPDNVEYPFSQPFVYVYQQNPSPKVKDFLGFILAKPGQESIKAARQAEALAIMSSQLQTVTTPTLTSTEISTATPTATSTIDQNPSLSPIPTNPATEQPIEVGNQIKLVNPFTNPSMLTKNLGFLLLLPLFLIVGLISCLPLLWGRKKRSLNATTESNSNILDSEDSEDNYLFQEATKETLDAAIPPTTTNNHNGLNGNHSPEDIFPQATAANNLALTQTISPKDQIKEINELDLDYNRTMWDTEAPVIVVNNHYPPIPSIHHDLIESDIPIDEFTNSLLETPEPLTSTSSDQKTMSLSELLNRPPAPIQAPIKEDKYISLSELLGISFPSNHQSSPTQKLVSDLPSNLEEALNSITNDIELNIPQIAEEILPTPSPSTTTDENIAMELDAEIAAWTTINQINANENTRIIFTPRTPKWAYVSWYISDSDKLKQNINHQKRLQNQGFMTLAVRLYDVTNLDLSYQLPELVQQYECETAIHDCYIPIPKGERDYMTEIGYLINDHQWLCLARSGTVHVFSGPSTDFWFVVDTELVIYGATKQDAIVTIDGQNVKLNADGTFKVSVPFVDNLVDYQMTATSANEENTKTIYQKFFQEQKEN
ncbi:substrate-binding domain-containing protein [Dolichospermum circinale]|uniref:Substrate-binding domain-containing protein n=1 Tax=Dolichospermum circinale CS-537/01 TaxID=3021739 RepID=A0ABT5ABF0_9CYAN|nr:substrate-binding domain-containing protein [Dolichospermum circinale]MDB9468614.1 substrate-binding domain-containing protein [Dolichospermum circinale CS-539/09]MDB9471513.1 substrate-binding domain-containing protein [Dolichospermum circinale CS-539]MDB9488779.1 substrate-binding domain-containing protein [Dolichospermum circinale CS-537/01]